MEFKKIRLTSEEPEAVPTDSTEIYLLQEFQGAPIKFVPADERNYYFQQLLQQISEGYEIWEHDEEIDWEQAWANRPLPEDPNNPEEPENRQDDPIVGDN